MFQCHPGTIHQLEEDRHARLLAEGAQDRALHPEPVPSRPAAARRLVLEVAVAVVIMILMALVLVAS